MADGVKDTKKRLRTEMRTKVRKRHNAPDLKKLIIIKPIQYQKKEKIIIFNVLELFLAYFRTFNIFTL